MGKFKKIILLSLQVTLSLVFTANPIFATFEQDYRAVFNGHPFYSSSIDCAAGSSATGALVLTYPDQGTDQEIEKAINDYIGSYTNTNVFEGLGEHFVKGGKRSNVNPFLAVAQLKHESGFATGSPNGWHNTTPPSHNSFGRTASKSQPHVTKGKRLVYRWNSWADSLYDTSEHEDDWFAYIRRVYLERNQLGPSDLKEYVHIYAPNGDGANNESIYIDSITKYMHEVATPIYGGDSASGSRICIGGGAGSLVDVAQEFAWQDNRGRGYYTMRPAYAAAVKEAQSNGEYVGGVHVAGVDCGGFVTRLMRSSGFDSDYNTDTNGPIGGYASRGGGTTAAQLPYLKNTDNGWEEITVNSTDDLSPGDVAIRRNQAKGTGHTFVWIGPDAGFETSIVSSAISPKRKQGRAPMSGTERPVDSRLNWFRKVN